MAHINSFHPASLEDLKLNHPRNLVDGRSHTLYGEFAGSEALWVKRLAAAKSSYHETLIAAAQS